MMIDQRLLPYYVTRALISTLLGFWMATELHTWLGGLLIGALVFIGFLWIAHGGWYQIKPEHPLFPVRRDERGQAIRNQALAAAVAVGGVVFAIASVLTPSLSLAISASTLGVLTALGCYAAVTCWRFLIG